MRTQHGASNDVPRQTVQVLITWQSQHIAQCPRPPARDRGAIGSEQNSGGRLHDDSRRVVAFRNKPWPNRAGSIYCTPASLTRLDLNFKVLEPSSILGSVKCFNTTVQLYSCTRVQLYNCKLYVFGTNYPGTACHVRNVRPTMRTSSTVG